MGDPQKELRSATWTLHALRALLGNLKRYALDVGRYGPPYTTQEYDERDKGAAFRCMAYNETLNHITALERAIVQWEEAKVQSHG